ncbi:MAG TPA: DUF962 domain-containing protein [Acidimicrobiia bacterium]|nr:DUF962 domain-containing protein [Acidimicrobiia bacterium]
MINLSNGVPGVNGPEPRNSEEFYAFYLSQHLHPKTRIAHVVGVTLGVGFLVAAVVTMQPWLLLGLPVSSYAFAVPAHFIWEGNRPALTNGAAAFVWSIRADARQALRFWTRRIDADVAAVRAALGLRDDEVTLADAAARLAA